MVTKVFPTTADFENLSRRKTQTTDAANDYDFSSVVVNKPWGYEYLWYQNPNVAIWLLHLNRDAATSLHCHIWKRTSLIVISGRVVCSTLDGRHNLTPQDALVLQSCVFHSTLAVSNAGACVMEVESPPMKGDLVRMKDGFGRANAGYEGAGQYTTDLAKYQYSPFPIANNPATQQLHGMTVRRHLLETRQQAAKLCATNPLIIPVMGKFWSGMGVAVETGEVCTADNIQSALLTDRFAPVELLTLEPTTA